MNKDSTTERNLLIVGLITIVLGVIQVLAFPPLIIGAGFVRSLIPFITSGVFIVLGWKMMWFLLIPGTFLLGSSLGVVFNYPYGGALLGAGVGLLISSFPRSK
ncbi:MAG TPA: hypothetical protein PK233_06420 [Candidatus Atribacteria bacterium]|nr:hypothetical protein [Candidatus Atribacteria bacterium]